MNTTINTKDLEDMLSSENGLKNFINNRKSNKLIVHLFLSTIMKQQDISRSQLIEKAGLNRVYAYEVFRGEKRPSRNILLRMLISLNLDFQQVQLVLKRLGYPILYAKNFRDAIIIYCLKNQKDVDDVCILLYDSGHDII